MVFVTSNLCQVHSHCFEILVFLRFILIKSTLGFSLNCLEKEHSIYKSRCLLEELQQYCKCKCQLVPVVLVIGVSYWWFQWMLSKLHAIMENTSKPLLRQKSLFSSRMSIIQCLKRNTDQLLFWLSNASPSRLNKIWLT